MKKQETKTSNRNGKIDLDKIAKSDGFPEFVAELEGFGNYRAYTNGKLVRVYDPETGKRVHEYRPKNVSPMFHNPVEVVSLVPSSIQTTGYAKRIKDKYYR